MAEPESYPELVAQLAAGRARLASRQRQIIDWYEQQCAAAGQATAAADDAVRAARAEVAAARAAASRVDTEAGLLWRSVRVRVGRGAAARLETLPEPAAPSPAADAPSPLVALRRARDRLTDAPAVQSSGALLYLLCAALGALLGGGAGILARDRPLAQRIAFTLVGVVFALVPARLVSRLAGARTDLAGTVLTLLAGVLAGGAVVALRR